MPFDLAALLPQLLPLATEWARMQEAQILREGRALDDHGLTLARAVGVKEPELVRLRHVDAIPWPEASLLRRAAMHTGLLGPSVQGLTLGHGIFLVGRRRGRRLLAHELRHVHQYEMAGSIGAFLKEYLRQIAVLGYDEAPYEVDARAWEQH